MTRVFAYNTQDSKEVQYITYNKILDLYFDYWSGQMQKVGKIQDISFDRCVEDWVMVNWAWEINNQAI